MLSEKEIIQNFRKGSQKAFALLYHEYSQSVYALSCKYLGSIDEAEDVVQDLFCQVWEMRECIDPNRPFNRFLFTILKNKLLNILRDRKINYTLSDPVIYEKAMFYQGLQEDEDFDDEQILIVKKAIEQLSPQKRKVFELKLTGRFSNQEIADQLSVSVNTIKFQYSQSLKEIKSTIESITYLWILMNLPFH